MPSSKSESSPFLVSIGDLFGQPIFLNLRKQQAVSTSLGGLLTLILILLMVSQFAFDIIKMTDRQNPQILQINEVSNDPLPVLLNQSNNFNFAISTTVNGQHINMTTGSILNFKAASSLYLRNGENKTKYEFQINFSPCEPSDFSDSIFGNQTYEMYQIQYAYCPRYISYFLPNGTCPDFIEAQYPNCVSPLVFNISGTYLLSYFSFIQFNFTLCDNTDPNVQTPSQMQCMNLSDIYSLFNNDVQVQVNFFFANNLINPVLYQTPNQTYLDFIYWDVNPRLFKVADIFVSNQIVQDYDSYYSSTDNQNSTFYHIDSSQLREQQSYLFTNVTNQSILEFNLRGDVSSSVITRVYMKVQDVMSQLGGLAKSIMVGFAFIALGYANFKYHMVVSNELYDFEPVDDNDTKKTENKKRLERKKEMENIRKRLDGNNLKERIIQRDYMKDALAQQIEEEEAEKEKVKDYFEYQKKKQRRLKYNEVAYLKSLICCRKATPEEQIAEKARAQVEEDVDLIQILQKLKEVDKLKGLLLDRNQRELFDYIPKPLLTVEGDQPVNCSFDVSYIGADFQAEKDMAGIIQRRENFNSLSEYAKLYISYRGVKSAKDPLKQNHNKKLLAMLGPDLIKVFEHVDKEVGDEVHPEHFEAIIKKALDYSQHHKTIRVEY